MKLRIARKARALAHSTKLPKMRPIRKSRVAITGQLSRVCWQGHAGASRVQTLAGYSFVAVALPLIHSQEYNRKWSYGVPIK